MAKIKCAHCKGIHASVADVRQCAYEESMHEAEAAAEYAAERAAERFWEEGPHGPQDDPIERALWAMEDARRELWGERRYEGFDGTMQAHPPIWR